MNLIERALQKDGPDYYDQGMGAFIHHYRNPDGPALAAEIERLTAQVERMREALGWYADTFCEYSTCNEGCGKFDDDVCAGCKARALSYRGGN